MRLEKSVKSGENKVKQILDKIYAGNREILYKKIIKKLKYKEPQMIITANPEIVMWAEREKDIYHLLLDEKDVEVIADGIGIVKAGKMLLNKNILRIPGIEVVEQILKIADKNKYSLFVYGSKEEVLKRFQKVLEENYKNICVLGLKNGYDSNPQKIACDIKALKPDVVLVALGVPKQELYIKNYLFPLEKGVYIGVGGSIDVLAGMVKRAPQFFINNNLEWLYRIVKEPKRMKRFYENNIKFLLKGAYIKLWEK